MNKKTVRRRGRRRSNGNNSAELTRAAFLAAARRAFAAHGYDRTGLREIASAAGADKRLITRYFGSKEQLFTEALLSALDKFEPGGGDFGDFGRRFADRIFGNSQLTRRDRIEFISLCVNSVGSPIGKRLVRANVAGQIGQIASRLQGEDADVRAALILAVILGASMLQEVLKIDQFVTLGVDKANAYIAPMLQRLVDAPSPAAAAPAAPPVTSNVRARRPKSPAARR